MDVRRVGVLLGKEVAHGTRTFIFIFATVIPVAVSLILALVFGRLLAGTPRLGLIDEGQSQMQALFVAQDYLSTRGYTSAEALRRDVEAGRVDMGVVIPPGFDAAVRQGVETELSLYFWGEGAVLDRATLITALASNVLAVSGRAAPVTVSPVVVGGAAIVSWADQLLPVLVLMAIVLGGALVPAVSLVDEKQRRTLPALTVTPASLADVMLAKALLGMGTSLVMGLLILALNRAFGAQPALLVGVMALGAAAAALLGLLLGAVSKDIAGLFTVVKSLALVLYAPAIIELVPQLPQWLARLFPTYYIIGPVQAIALRGAGLADVAGDLAVLAGLIAALMIGLAGVVGWQQRRPAAA
jgi:ABC-2 type transport system permease protein